jgi:hypothetical protein
MSYEIHRVAVVFPRPMNVGVMMDAKGMTACGHPTWECSRTEKPLAVGQSVGSILYGSQPGDLDRVCEKCFTEADFPRLVQEGWK